MFSVGQRIDPTVYFSHPLYHFLLCLNLVLNLKLFTIEKSGLVDAQTSYKILFTLFYFYQMFWFLWTLFRHDPFKKSPRCHHLVQI
jgi:hypothetical protein